MPTRPFSIVPAGAASVLAAAALLTAIGLPAGEDRGPLGPSPGWIAAASAQETMRFERVPAESSEARETGRRDNLRTRVSVPGVQIEVGGHPEAPEPPEPPEPPTVVRSGDVVRIGSDIHIERGQRIEGDVFALRGDIRVDGHVRGDVASTGGDVHLGPEARVEGDVMCIGGQLIEDPGSYVGGQRVTALQGRGARIRRNLEDRIEDRVRDRRDRHRVPGAIGFSISWLLLTMLGAWGIARLAPERTRVALERLRSRPGTSLGLGFLGVLLLGPSLVALALAMAILCITIVGIPLALLLFPAYGLLLALIVVWGFTLGACTVGIAFRERWVKSAPATLPRHAVLGALVLSGLLVGSSILHALPFFGWVSTLMWVVGWVGFGLLTMAGAGALLASKFGQGPDGRWPWSRAPRGPATAAGGAAPPAAPAPAAPAAPAPSAAPPPPSPPPPPA